MSTSRCFRSRRRFKLAAKKAASIPCGLCKVKPPLDATKSCLDCKVSYCNECYKNFHVWGTSRAQHEHIGPTHNFRPKVSKELLNLESACNQSISHYYFYYIYNLTLPVDGKPLGKTTSGWLKAVLAAFTIYL